MKKRVVALALILAWLLSSTALAADTTAPEGPDAGTDSGQSQPEETGEQEGESGQEEQGGENTPEQAGSLLASDRHTAYMSGSSGRFRPDGNISRAEAAQMIYRLLPQQPVEITAAYTDVADTAWYAQAALTLGTLGVIRPGQTEFLPDEELTRGEFIRCLAFFFVPRADAQQFADVAPDHPDAAYLLTARAWGWLSGFEDGTVRPDAALTRAEAVVLVNRAIGRTPDKAYIDSARPVFYLDVAPGSWYYYDVVEASVSHEHTGSGETERWSKIGRASCRERV